MTPRYIFIYNDFRLYTTFYKEGFFMDTTIPITESIFWIGVNDRQTHLFESIWPLPRGVSYNSYLIKDEKTALIDTVKHSSSTNFMDKIKLVLPNDKPIDYLIINHMEPDHSGSITLLRKLYPNIRIIGNKKTLEYLNDFYGITENVQTIDDGDTLSLGKHKLQFFITPMVHWPETMMTFDHTDKILFSGDAFGGFGTLDTGIFDDEVDVSYFDDEILRYFSNIVGKYSAMVQKAIAKLKDLPIGIIAATHGPIWRKDPGHIITLYDKWSRNEPEKGIVIVYASMYGNTEKMMEAIARGIGTEYEKCLRIHNISTTHLSYIIRDIWRYRGLILGAPTYNMKLFPPMNSLTTMLENKLLKNRVIGLFGTFTWSGGAVSTLSEFAQKVKWPLVEPVIEAKCSPDAENIEQCVLLGKNMARIINDTVIS